MAQSLIPHGGNDKVYTPDDLALKIVKHFKKQIKGRVLEPCAGHGAFVRALQKEGFKPVELELDRGLDFFEHHGKVDWIITNPPWSKARDFARHAYTISHDVVFLITANHFTALKARFRDMREAGFAMREIVLVDTPPAPWPQSGFQLTAIHFQKGWKGKTRFICL
jgi:tRNA1(Val) A37 N6-methylase TrmN6